MADMNRVRSPLEIAAESPDPVVREMAIRRIEIGREIVSLDAFFTMYEGARAKATSAPKAESKTESRPVSKRDMLADKVKEILLERGPLDIKALHEAYCILVPEDAARTLGALRVALTHRTQIVDRVSETDRRYWPVGAPLNGAHASVP